MMIPDWAKLKPINSVTTNNTGSSKMITQEMVDVVKRYCNCDSVKTGWMLDDAESGLTVAEALLNAVYPMISNQVLEKAAREAERHYYAQKAAREIRNLKDKTDEAHNG